MAVASFNKFGAAVAILCMSQTLYSLETLFQCQKNVVPEEGMTSLAKAFTITGCALKVKDVQSSDGFAWIWEQSSCETYSSELSGILVKSEREEMTFCMEIQMIYTAEQQCITSLGDDYFVGVYSEIKRVDTNSMEEAIYSKFEVPSLSSSFTQEVKLLTLFAPSATSKFQFKMTCSGNCTLQISSNSDIQGLRNIIQFSSNTNSSSLSPQMNLVEGCHYLLQAKLVFSSAGYLRLGIDDLDFEIEDPISVNLFYGISWTKQ